MPPKDQHLATIKALESRIGHLSQQLDFANAKLEETTDQQTAHQADIEELLEYKKENGRLIEGLQQIADGRGKYAKLARETIGQ